MSPPPTGFAGPLKGAPLVAWQSQFHGGRWKKLLFAQGVSRDTARTV
ncbi:hypothetical protein [Roseateles sp. BYS87W]|uniref:Uncharacterized protein n=1 Tax=Pelomonas baiyunensis TaxID=3299026 RepID=A0ABW7H4Y7_9BURK